MILQTLPSIINTISACTNWAVSLFSVCGLSLLAFFSVALGLSYAFRFITGALK